MIKIELRKEFSLSDLENGMIVETRRGTLLMVLDDNLINDECWVSLCNYSEDLTRYEFMKDDYRDIMKVYFSEYNQTIKDKFKNKILIWERYDCKEMTVNEIEKELGYRIKIKGDK